MFLPESVAAIWHNNQRRPVGKDANCATGLQLVKQFVMAKNKIRRKLLAAHRKMRELRMIVKGLASTRHPLLVHIIPTRRCNLACTYCNEYDDFSQPVPTEEMFRRIDRLGAIRTGIITISGGE